jgi:tetratricopeptide (TPR) repeat protein
MVVGMAKLTINADLEALDWLRRSIEANPNHALSHFHFAGALAMVGDLKQARSSAEAGLALDPSFTIRRYRNNIFFLRDNPAWLAKLERFYEGLRMAEVPER